MHGNSVKLQGKAQWDGEIFNKSLVIEPNVQFEGVSRPLDPWCATMRPVLRPPRSAWADRQRREVAGAAQHRDAEADGPIGIKGDR